MVQITIIATLLKTVFNKREENPLGIHSALMVQHFGLSCYYCFLNSTINATNANIPENGSEFGEKSVNHAVTLIDLTQKQENNQDDGELMENIRQVANSPDEVERRHLVQLSEGDCSEEQRSIATEPEWHPQQELPPQQQQAVLDNASSQGHSSDLMKYVDEQADLTSSENYLAPPEETKKPTATWTMLKAKLPVALSKRRVEEQNSTEADTAKQLGR